MALTDGYTTQTQKNHQENLTFQQQFRKDVKDAFQTDPTLHNLNHQTEKDLKALKKDLLSHDENLKRSMNQTPAPIIAAIDKLLDNKKKYFTLLHDDDDDDDDEQDKSAMPNPYTPDTSSFKSPMNPSPMQLVGTGEKNDFLIDAKVKLIELNTLVEKCPNDRVSESFKSAAGHLEIDLWHMSYGDNDTTQREFDAFKLQFEIFTGNFNKWLKASEDLRMSLLSSDDDDALLSPPLASVRGSSSSISPIENAAADIRTRLISVYDNKVKINPADLPKDDNSAFTYKVENEAGNSIISGNIDQHGAGDVTFNFEEQPFDAKEFVEHLVNVLGWNEIELKEEDFEDGQIEEIKAAFKAHHDQNPDKYLKVEIDDTELDLKSETQITPKIV